MHVIIWTYDVPLPARSAFEAAYGSDGAWAKLFAKAPGFLGVELVRTNGAVYVTIDRWRDPGSHVAFMRTFAADYGALDAQCAALTSAEHKIGAFEVVG